MPGGINQKVDVYLERGIGKNHYYTGSILHYFLPGNCNNLVISLSALTLAFQEKQKIYGSLNDPSKKN